MKSAESRNKVSQYIWRFLFGVIALIGIGLAINYQILPRLNLDLPRWASHIVALFPLLIAPIRKAVLLPITWLCGALRYIWDGHPYKVSTHKEIIKIGNGSEKWVQVDVYHTIHLKKLDKYEPLNLRAAAYMDKRLHSYSRPGDIIENRIITPPGTEIVLEFSEAPTDSTAFKCSFTGSAYPAIWHKDRITSLWLRAYEVVGLGSDLKRIRHRQKYRWLVKTLGAPKIYGTSVTCWTAWY